MVLDHQKNVQKERKKLCQKCRAERLLQSKIHFVYFCITRNVEESDKLFFEQHFVTTPGTDTVDSLQNSTSDYKKITSTRL